ncbi:MAG TPA: 3-methyl-2-oxobutanoate hydroxymethyltransferase [Acidimicrobiales bacterium]|jgi:3-methyl-2-oxobutanoate hydroxymethyltransferase|nr:3-methyl-2-oxobutanoate hydroxymethyltransferase [Acidimicrobiales bacterium]
MATKVTAPALAGRKRRLGAAPIVMVTAYDFPSARIVDGAGVDAILVGDSLANVVLGLDDTLSVGIDEMAYHVAAVARARPNALVVADMPWMSYHVGTADTLRNAATLIRAGADAVKLEGGRRRLDVLRALLDAEIPVMGHLGLTPQSVRAMGGLRVQARAPREAAALELDAEALAAAGCFAIVLEGVPDVVARRVTEAIEVPTIGIGAGAACDGQVLVLHDLLGLTESPPRFVRRYAELAQAARLAVAAYAADVRAGTFPAEAETYHAPPGLEEALAREAADGAPR